MSVREDGRRRYWRQVRELAESEGLELPQARQRWREVYAVGGRLKRRVQGLVVALTAKAASTCPFCRDGFEDTSVPFKVCPGCKTRFHEECWSDHGRCTTLGCAGGRDAPRVVARPADGVCACCGTPSALGPCPCDVGECVGHRSFGSCRHCNTVGNRSRGGSGVGYDWEGTDLCAECLAWLSELEAGRRLARARLTFVLSGILVIAFIMIVIAAKLI